MREGREGVTVRLSGSNGQMKIGVRDISCNVLHAVHAVHCCIGVWMYCMLHWCVDVLRY